MNPHLLIGLSTRAMAESAVKSHPDVLTLDFFGDQDQKDLTSNFSLAREYKLPFSAENLLKASNGLLFDTVSYTSNLENHPDVVAALAKRATLAGNGPETIRCIRDWSVLREFCRESSIPYPVTLLPGEEGQASATDKWLCKPVNGGGGSNVCFWDGRALDELSILQMYMEGIPASAAFVADGKQGVVLGLTRQLIGLCEFGVSGHAWCGNILPLSLESGDRYLLLKEVENILNKLIGRFGLKGVGGMDFIFSKGKDGKMHPFLIEINPRYTGSMELIEWAYGLNLYTMHLEACDGRLPEFNLSEHISGNYYGKSIVFARKGLTIKSTKEWSKMGRKDIPFPGEEIKPGQPICTLFSTADTHDACLGNLFVNADNIRKEIGDMWR